MTERKKFQSHDQYLADAAEDVRPILQRIQGIVEAAVPDAARCISYNIPAYKLKKVFFYFAAFKNHVGIYPPLRNDAALILELGQYRGEKGNLTFKLAEPIPYELIGRLVIALAKEHGGK